MPKKSRVIMGELRREAFGHLENSLVVKRLLVACLLALGAILLIRPRYQVGESAPKGIYVPRGEIERGGFVIACLERVWGELAVERGYLRAGRCPGGAAPVLKTVWGLGGDVVSVGLDGIAVNGEVKVNSGPRSVDSQGRGLASYPHGEFTLKPGYVWLGSEHERGFDSRNFGPVEAESVEPVALVVEF